MTLQHAWPFGPSETAFLTTCSQRGMKLVYFAELQESHELSPVTAGHAGAGLSQLVEDCKSTATSDRDGDLWRRAIITLVKRSSCVSTLQDNNTGIDRSLGTLCQRRCQKACLFACKACASSTMPPFKADHPQMISAAQLQHIVAR